MSAIETAYREGYADGYRHGEDHTQRYETGGGAVREPEKLAAIESAWSDSCAKRAPIPELLAFAETVANSTSGNLHGFYSHIVTGARKAVFAAGGELNAVGRYRAGEADPMSREDWDKLKHARFLKRMQDDGMVWSEERQHWVKEGVL